MKFAILPAVSTAYQATPDKVSLEEQEAKCRAVAVGKGWTEAVPPYVVKASRSFYVDLSVAEKDIPRLRDMLDDARSGAFDVLVIYSYDRLGDLLDLVAMPLSFYGTQIYSVSQPVEPQDPRHYDRYAAEGEDIMRAAAKITQRFRISDLRRKRAAGMPKRISKGLPAARIPFGYRWKGKKEAPEQIEQEAELVIRMKDMFLSGRAVSELLRYADSTGLKPPNGGKHWQDSSVRAMLLNPFYAGFVSIKRYKTVRDPRKGHKPRQVHLPRSQWVMNKGLHEALWDEGTWNMIAAEMDRRHQANMHMKVRFPFSGILKCGVCGAKLHRVQHSHGKYAKRMWVCSVGHSAHIAIRYDDGTKLVAEKFGIEMRNINPHKASTDIQRLKIAELQARRKRVQDGYEAGGYDLVEFTRIVNEIEADIEKNEAEILQASQAEAWRAQVRAIAEDERFKDFPTWLMEADPAFINAVLRAAFKDIILYPDGKVEFINL